MPSPAWDLAWPADDSGPPCGDSTPSPPPHVLALCAHAGALAKLTLDTGAVTLVLPTSSQHFVLGDDCVALLPVPRRPHHSLALSRAAASLVRVSPSRVDLRVGRVDLSGPGRSAAHLQPLPVAWAWLRPAPGGSHPSLSDDAACCCVATADGGLWLLRVGPLAATRRGDARVDAAPLELTAVTRIDLRAVVSPDMGGGFVPSVLLALPGGRLLILWETGGGVTLHLDIGSDLGDGGNGSASALSQTGSSSACSASFHVNVSVVGDALTHAGPCRGLAPAATAGDAARGGCGADLSGESTSDAFRGATRSAPPPPWHPLVVARPCGVATVAPGWGVATLGACASPAPGVAGTWAFLAAPPSSARPLPPSAVVVLSYACGASRALSLLIPLSTTSQSQFQSHSQVPPGTSWADVTLELGLASSHASLCAGRTESGALQVCEWGVRSLREISTTSIGATTPPAAAARHPCEWRLPQPASPARCALTVACVCDSGAVTASHCPASLSSPPSSTLLLLTLNASHAPTHAPRLSLAAAVPLRAQASCVHATAATTAASHPSSPSVLVHVGCYDGTVTLWRLSAAPPPPGSAAASALWRIALQPGEVPHSIAWLAASPPPPLLSPRASGAACADAFASSVGDEVLALIGTRDGQLLLVGAPDCSDEAGAAAEEEEEAEEGGGWSARRASSDAAMPFVAGIDPDGAARRPVAGRWRLGSAPLCLLPLPPPPALPHIQLGSQFPTPPPNSCSASFIALTDVPWLVGAASGAQRVRPRPLAPWAGSHSQPLAAAPLPRAAAAGGGAPATAVFVTAESVLLLDVGAPSCVSVGWGEPFALARGGARELCHVAAAAAMPSSSSSSSAPASAAAAGASGGCGGAFVAPRVTAFAAVSARASQPGVSPPGNDDASPIAPDNTSEADNDGGENECGTIESLPLPPPVAAAADDGDEPPPSMQNKSVEQQQNSAEQPGGAAPHRLRPGEVVRALQLVWWDGEEPEGTGFSPVIVPARRPRGESPAPHDGDGGGNGSTTDDGAMEAGDGDGDDVEMADAVDEAMGGGGGGVGGGEPNPFVPPVFVARRAARPRPSHPHPPPPPRQPAAGCWLAVLCVEVSTPGRPHSHGRAFVLRLSPAAATPSPPPPPSPHPSPHAPPLPPDPARDDGSVSHEWLAVAAVELTAPATCCAVHPTLRVIALGMDARVYVLRLRLGSAAGHGAATGRPDANPPSIDTFAATRLRFAVTSLSWCGDGGLARGGGGGVGGGYGGFAAHRFSPAHLLAGSERDGAHLLRLDPNPHPFSPSPGVLTVLACEQSARNVMHSVPCLPPSPTPSAAGASPRAVAAVADAAGSFALLTVAPSGAPDDGAPPPQPAGAIRIGAPVAGAVPPFPWPTPADMPAAARCPLGGVAAGLVRLEDPIPDPTFAPYTHTGHPSFLAATHSGAIVSIRPLRGVSSGGDVVENEEGGEGCGGGASGVLRSARLAAAHPLTRSLVPRGVHGGGDSGSGGGGGGREGSDDDVWDTDGEAWRCVVDGDALDALCALDAAQQAAVLQLRGSALARAVRAAQDAVDGMAW